MKPVSAKRKGTKLEKWVSSQLSSLGIRSRRQPGSGIYQDFPHDVAATIADHRLIIECKHWKHGWRTGDNAMGKADLLVIKRDFHDPCVYMPWSTFEWLCQTALVRDDDDSSTD